MIVRQKNLHTIEMLESETNNEMRTGDQATETHRVNGDREFERDDTHESEREGEKAGHEKEREQGSEEPRKEKVGDDDW